MRVQGKARTMAAVVAVAALSAVALGIYALRSREGDGPWPAPSTSARGFAPANECDPVVRADEEITPRLTAAAQATESTLGYTQYNPPDKSRASSTDDVRCKQSSEAADQG